MTEPLLRISNLHAWYGESHVLHGVDMHVAHGETVCLLGRNGVGKSTTLRAITGLMPRREGNIRFANKDLMKLPMHHIARVGLGYVPEERGIFFSLSVQENLLLPPTVAPGGMELDEIYDLFPNLLERRSSSGGLLSGGEQQMLAIARILRTGCNCILLDEPSEGLAPVIIQRIGQALNTLKRRGMTVLIVEQNFSFAAKIADRFYIMDHGQMVDEFSASQVAERRASLHQFLGV